MTSTRKLYEWCGSSSVISAAWADHALPTCDDGTEGIHNKEDELSSNRKWGMPLVGLCLAPCYVVRYSTGSKQVHGTQLYARVRCNPPR